VKTLQEVSVADLHRLPETPIDMLRLLGGPVWFRVPGSDRSRCRAVTTLVHGNEPSGLFALHRVLREGWTPAVDVICCVASVHAALAEPIWSHRFLPGGRDLNRCFVAPYSGLEGELAADIVRLLERARPEALVDLHNTSGTGPAYGVSEIQSDPIERLNACFCDLLVLTSIRLNTLVEAAEAICPALTVECGGAHDAAAHITAYRGLRAFTATDLLLETPIAPPRVYENPVRVEMRPDTRVLYADAPVAGVDLTLRLEFDRYNFGVIEQGEMLGWLGARSLDALQLRGGDQLSDASELFRVEDGCLIAARAMRPLMITTNPSIALSDCLFYAVVVD
jgi:predicted deacylase